MPYLPELKEGNQTRTMTDVFGGYNHNLKINEGEWYAEENLTGAYFPLFAQRGKRGRHYPPVGSETAFGEIRGIIAKDALAWIEGDQLFYNGYSLTDPVPGITLSEHKSMLPKQMVSMGAYLCVFPDNVYVNTKDISDRGSMGAKYESLIKEPDGTQKNAMINYTPCDISGKAYENITASTAEPPEPVNGMYWMDQSSSPHTLKQYSETSGMWVEIPTVYVKISVTGIGQNFADYDGVTLSGAAYTHEDDTGNIIQNQIAALNGDIIIQARGDDYIIVVGVLDQAAVTQEAVITVERKIPVLDYVCEANNRLWGCYYGMKDGRMVNEIYACKLGDFKNWHCFMGISSDSYTVSVGTDGPFTGCAAYLGYPIFFKENCIHKIYGSFPANFQTQTTQCRGVQQGSGGSIAIVNEILYYKSPTDICAYDGSLPAGISTQFGGEMYSSAVAGSMNGCYYISMKDVSGAWHLFVYDTLRGVWHRHDDAHITGFAAWGQELYFIHADKNAILTMNGSGEADEQSVSWYAESGVIGYDMPDNKYVSRFNLRMKLGEGAKVTLKTEYDSDGVWHDQGTVTGNGLDAFIFPVIPRRCDHFRMRLEGEGDVRMYSMCKILEQGSDA